MYKNIDFSFKFIYLYFSTSVHTAARLTQSKQTYKPISKLFI